MGWCRRMRQAVPVLLCAWGLSAAAADASLPAPVPPEAAQAAVCPPPLAAPSAAELARWQREAQDRGFLWRIQGHGHASWLYGTLHVARAEWSFPGPHLQDALNRSERIALEMDPLDPGIGQRMQALATRHAGRWPAALLARGKAQAAAACLPAALVDQLHPAMLLSAVSTGSLRAQGLEVAYAPEFVLSGLARARRLPVVSLESPELQAQALLGNGPPDATELAEGLQDLESGRTATMTAALVRDWTRSDWEHLQDYAAWCDCLRTAADRAAMRRLVDDRNPGLARSIDRLHRGGPLLVAVGALHMAGPQGLLALLRQRGYRVDMVPPAAPAGTVARPARSRAQ